jgi:nucleoside triphosphate diphosphatase
MSQTPPDPLAAPIAPGEGIARLLAIMARLRDPDRGCPWDLEQDFASIAPYTIEEAYEVADAIERQDWTALKGELGDLLLQSVYHAQMGAEAGLFDFDAIARASAEKMIARHPHVFAGQPGPGSAEAQITAWEAMKAVERSTARPARTLDGIATALPALTRAVKLQNRAASVGFDWPDAGAVLEKIAEETAELVEARDQLGPEALAEEYGDLMFVLANLARHLDIDPEAALRAANAKFTRRFEAIEDALAETGRRPADSTLVEMDALWTAAKERERHR